MRVVIVVMNTTKGVMKTKPERKKIRPVQKLNPRQAV